MSAVNATKCPSLPPPSNDTTSARWNDEVYSPSTACAWACACVCACVCVCVNASVSRAHAYVCARAHVVCGRAAGLPDGQAVWVCLFVRACVCVFECLSVRVCVRACLVVVDEQ
jgi:hypothetical protein